MIKRPLEYRRFDRTRTFAVELFYLPRIFFAWIIFHIASWLGMETAIMTDNVDVEDLFEDILKDVESTVKNTDLDNFDFDLDDDTKS